MRRLLLVNTLFVFGVPTQFLGDNMVATASTYDVVAAPNTQSEERTINGTYSSISLSNAIHMIVEDRKDGLVVIKAPEDIMPYIVLQEKNGILRAGLDTKGKKTIRYNGNIEIAVPYSEYISSVDVSGASSLSIKPPIKSKQFDIDLSGSAHMNAELYSDVCKADISGASSLDLSFEGNIIFVDASGASTANLELMCANSSFDLSGASNVRAFGNCENVESRSSGASKLITAKLSREKYRGSSFPQIDDNTYFAATQITPQTIQQNAPSTSITTATQPTPSIQSKSDVDINIPTSDNDNKNTFVLIIANENYAFVDNVEFALNDGKTFREYCIKTLGVPERQVWLYENASLGIISSGVNKMAQAMNIFNDAKAIIYYCGHGIPDEKTGDAYIVPVDGQGTDVSSCYSLNKLYKTMASAKTSNVTYFMDACFTGANRDGSMLVAARGVAREPKKEVITGNAVVFSAASGDETAMPFKEKGHGMFTYFLLKKLQDTKGDVTYGELAEYINENVKKEAFFTNNKPQNPVVATSKEFTASWQNVKMR